MTVCRVLVHCQWKGLPECCLGYVGSQSDRHTLARVKSCFYLSRTTGVGSRQDSSSAPAEGKIASSERVQAGLGKQFTDTYHLLPSILCTGSR